MEELNKELLDALIGLRDYFKFMIQDPNFHEYVKAEEAITKAKDVVKVSPEKEFDPHLPMVKPKRDSQKLVKKLKSLKKTGSEEGEGEDQETDIVLHNFHITRR